MDCRKPALLLAALLVGPGVGCSLLHPDSSKRVEFIQGGSIAPDEKGPRITPKAETCVAFGGEFETQGKDTARSEVEREHALEQARKAYQQALSIDANCQSAMLGLARTYDLMKDHEHALATYQRAIQAFPRSANVRDEAAWSHARAREWDAAIQCWQVALQLDPENRDYMRRLGNTLARVGRFDESYDVLRRADGDAKAHYSLARMLYHLHQDELCRDHLQLALKYDPQLAAARELLTKLDESGPREGGLVTVGMPNELP